MLRKLCICEVLEVAESIHCLVSLPLNEGKDGCYFGTFLSHIFDRCNLNSKRWV